MLVGLAGVGVGDRDRTVRGVRSSVKATLFRVFSFEGIHGTPLVRLEGKLAREKKQNAIEGGKKYVTKFCREDVGDLQK